MITITCAAYSQDEPKLFVSNAVTSLEKETPKSEWKVLYRKEAYTALTYGKDYLQIGTDPGAKFRLYGPVTKENTDDFFFISRQGYSSTGVPIETTTAYSNKERKMTVSITFINKAFIYELEVD